MTVLAVVIYCAIILVALMLIALVLVQQSKSGGLGGTFGGVGESLMGGQATNHLSKLTVYLSIAFFVLVLFISVMIGHGWAMKSNRSILEKATKVEAISADSELAKDTESSSSAVDSSMSAGAVEETKETN